MNVPVRIGMDTSKSVFQLHGVDENEVVVVRRQFRRAEMIRYFERLPPVLVAIESCGSSHHWGRLLQSFGHEVKLIPPQYVKAYVKRGKNDAADAEALCEAVTRPSMRFVPVKSKERQAACMLMTVRERLVSVKSQLSNAFRSYAAEFGIVGPAGRQNVAALIKRVLEDDSLPEMARDLFRLQADEYAAVQARLAKIEAKLMKWHREDDISRRIATIPGVGPIGSSMLSMKAPPPETFRSGRDFAAWLGLTPKDHSTGGRQRLGGITKAGDSILRSTLIVGATALLRHVRKGRSKVARRIAHVPTNLQDAVVGRTDRSIRASFRRLHWHQECRPCAWSVRSEHHLGQRALSAQTGRTSDSKRSGQKSATILTSGGPSTSAISTTSLTPNSWRFGAVRQRL
jgi:transposase